VRFFNKTGWIAAMAGGAAAALVATAAQAAPSALSAHSAPLTTAASRSVRLINGDRLVLRAGTTGTLVPVPGSGPVVSLGRGARALYLPVYAVPYLGRGLAPGLFSPASLSRAERGGRLGVQVSFTGRRPHLPGITITRWAAGIARGYLNPRVFGAALARQFRADHRQASYGTDGMFAGGVSIAPAGARPAPRARPDYPMHELTVSGTSEAGRPDTGDEVIVINAANWETFGDPIESGNVFYHGVSKFSVPAGPYWAVGWFAGSGKSADDLRMDVLPQFTVTGQHTRVHLDARAATSELGVVTPRPSVLKGFAFEVTRGGLDHTAFGAGVFGASGSKLWVNPTTARPSVGSLQVLAQETTFSPAHAAGLPYAYNLMFVGPDGIIPDLHWTVPAASLASTTERYFQEVRSIGQVYGDATYPGLGIGIGIPEPVRMPGESIEYALARPNAIYEVGYDQFPSGYGGGQNDAYYTVRPGQHFTEDWNQDPMHPQPMVQLLTGALGRDFPAEPEGFRAGNKLSLAPSVFSDNTPGHYGYGYLDFPKSGVKVTGSYAVYQNGVLIAHGNPARNFGAGVPPVTLSSKPATIRFVLNATRRGARYPLSPVSQTVWTWPSAPEPGATLPPTWACGFSTSRHCAVQPMMTLNYQVHGLGLNEATAAGQQVIGLTVGHIEPGAAVRVTGAKVQVSLDGGRTWQAATVTPAGSGQFTVSFTAPAGADVTLRTSATDAAGGSVTETIQDAYRS
jgi:hypothetical protein